MNRLISESEVSDHNMSSNIQDAHQITQEDNDYFTKTMYQNPDEFNTVRLNDPKVRYSNKMNSSGSNIKPSKK